MVLVIDDDTMFSKTLKTVLNRAGLECTTASSAELGLAVLEKNHIDVCFLDLKMPGMGGEAFLERYQEIQPSLKVVVLTGYPSAESMRNALRGELNAKAHDYLHKPVDNQELIRIAQKLSTSLVVDDFRLDTIERKLYHREQPIPLTPNEYRFTNFFMGHVDEWFNYQELHKLAFGEAVSSRKATDRLRSQMSEYRKKLQDVTGYEVIHSDTEYFVAEDSRRMKRPVYSFQRIK